MTNFTDNSKHFTARPRLYRVWVPLHDDGKAPLISIWIDPSLRAFEQDNSAFSVASVGQDEIDATRGGALGCARKDLK